MATEYRTFRLVCSEAQVPVVEKLLAVQGFTFEPEPFYQFARRLTGEPFPLGESFAARFGLIYIQDRSSMLPPLMLAPPVGASVLDMCSAPGSKTSLLSHLVGKEGVVFASEPSADRIGTLRANLRRTGSVNTATAKLKAQDLPFSDCSWDYIQLDPPCSGWGTVEKNPRVMELWSESKTGPLVSLQRTLLEKACAMLKPGGIVLFSTCTTNIKENEEQVAWALEHLDLELEPLPEPAGFVFGAPLLPNMDGVLRVAEDSAGQGFFLARFRKKATECADDDSAAQKAHLPGEPLDLKRLAGGSGIAISNLPPGEVYDFGGKAFFLHREALRKVPDGLRWQGHLLGKVAGKGDRKTFRPASAARILLDQTVCADMFEVEDTAVLERLLTGQGVSHVPGKGLVGLFYKGVPLAWLSRKGRRLLLQAK